VDLGQHVVGIRSNAPEVVDLLRRVLAPIRLDGIAVFPNLSLYVGDERGRVREMHRVSRRGVLVLTTPSLGRAVRAVLRHLEGLREPPPGLLPLNGALLVGPSGALIVNDDRALSRVAERRLSTTGWRRADGLRPVLDVVTGDVVVAGPSAAVDRAALAELERRFDADEDDSPISSGRHPLRAVLFVAGRAEELWSPAQRVAAIAALVDAERTSIRAADVAGIAGLVERCAVETVGSEPAQIVDALRAAAH
jgi:hypothetical protein